MKLKSTLLMIFAAFAMVACNDDDGISTSSVSVTMELPTALKDKAANVSNIVVTFENVNTGAVSKHQSNQLSLSKLIIEDGLYTIKVLGDVSYETSYTKIVENEDGAKEEQEVIQTVTNKLKGIGENITVKDGSLSIPLQLFIHKENAGNSFVISEVYFAGSKTPDGKQYSEDKFIEIYNNSNEVLYADGLCIAETELLTTMSLNEYTPDIREEAVPVSSVYRIPGSGKEHPVKPGETILLCDIAINHKTNNENSFDLSKANFEWFDQNDNYPDVDVPEVPNMEKMVSTSKSIWSLHNRGYTGYVLFRSEMPITPEQFTTDYAYAYKYHFVFGDFENWMDFDAWKAPNVWVIDAVQCSTPSAYEWNVMSPSLDISWTHSGDSDDTRYGHSVKRKVSHKEGDRIVLQDTNDSAFDFIPTALPSPGMVEEKLN